MVFTKDNVSTSYEKVEKLTRELNIHYRACIGWLIYWLSTRLYLIFAVHKLAKFLSNTGKVNFKGLVHLLRYIRDNKTYADMKDASISDLLRQANNKTYNQLPDRNLHHLPRLPTRISGGSRHMYRHPRVQAVTTACGHEGGGPVRDLPGPAQGVWRLGQVQVPIDIGRLQDWTQSYTTPEDVMG